MSARWVLDTNVLVSAILFRGTAHALRQAWVEGRVVPVASRAMIAEVQRVLVYPKFRLGPEAAMALYDQELRPYVELVPDAAGERVTSDPDDDVFLHVARAALVAAVVSGDADVLALRPVWQGIEVLTVAEAVGRLGA